MRLVELGRDAKELADVLDATVGLDGVLRLERADETRLVDDRLDDLAELARHVSTVLDGAAELAQGTAHLGAEDAALGDAGLRSIKQRQPVLGTVRADLVD